MRLATILPENGTAPLAVVAVDAQNWVSLHAFLSFFGTRDLPISLDAPLAQFLPILMPRFSELTRKVSDWPEHGRVFQKRGGKTVRAKRFLPPILRPPSFRDFHAFEQHVRTARARRGLDMSQAWYEIPVFYFSNPNSLIGHEAEVCPPANSNELDYELELGIVIGNRGRNVAPAQAWQHVAGFTIINDLSARDLQRAEMAVGLGPAKGKDFATAVGPVLITRDEFADKIDNEKIALEMRARVNGRGLSRGNSNALFHSFPKMIAQASRDADLFPGDLIGSGTVGMGCILEIGSENTGGWLKAGDVVELEVERVGTLRTKIVARPAA
jgi:2-keto-4-pentenoate hydratase/2-oxohepta-3-ene-1,7-dioic acid hydratase in catechol pathway